MKITIDFENFGDELKEWAAAEKDTPEGLIQRLALDRMRVYLLGKMAGQKEHHENVIEIIRGIGK